MSFLDKARKIDLIELCQECRISMPTKLTIPSTIEVIKIWEHYVKEFIKDRLEVMSSAIMEELSRSQAEERRLQMQLEEKKLEMEDSEKIREFEMKKL